MKQAREIAILLLLFLAGLIFTEIPVFTLRDVAAVIILMLAAILLRLTNDLENRS